MAVQVQPATYADLDVLANVIVKAHVENGLIPKMMGKASFNSQVKWYTDDFRKVWEEKGVHYFKAVEIETYYQLLFVYSGSPLAKLPCGNAASLYFHASTPCLYAPLKRFPWRAKQKWEAKLIGDISKIVGMARFHYPCKMSAEKKAREESNPLGSLPEGTHVELWQEFFEKLEHCEAKYIDKQKTYFVNLLAVLPEYHRKGLGKLLIDVCLNDADAARAETFLIATPAGSGLYKKLGFKEIDVVSWDTQLYGGDGLETWFCMTRQPIHSETNDSITPR